MRIVAGNLSAYRGGDAVFSDIGFTLESGELLVVTGANGAGKSTLLRLVAGLLPPAEGTIRLEGGGEQWPALAGAVHYLGHDNAMKPALTVRQNLRFWREFCGAPDHSVEEALEMVNLSVIGHLPFGYLSSGQKRRASLARLLVSHRPVWLLDEPTAGLDKASEARLAELIEGHLQKGGMAIAATHSPLGVAAAKTLHMPGLAGVPA